MSDILAARMGPVADQFVEAVNLRYAAEIEAVLSPLTRDELYALAVVLADRVPATVTDAERIQRAVVLAARRFGTSPDMILSGSTKREDSDARATVCYAAHLLGMSYSFIGRQIGRDHSTVMYSVGRVGETPRLRVCAHDIATRLGWTREVEAS
ncbi:MAG TPA: helix-turn-helix domain-containing protein [Aeromicrobium sp.]|nr:helix-turn-helix domain-containing protein [Aeromicrobium sp.]HKY58354.1 helix-turn-helix domain-containing protein [Aeromicrobium sp.]